MVTMLSLLTAMLLIVPYTYYILMKKASKKSWIIKADSSYTPKVSLILPTYNEALVITKKLDNIQKIHYPEDKLEVIIIDSASSDGTISKCKEYLSKNITKFPVILLSEDRRMGKAHALNIALKHTTREIVAISDADSFWKVDALRKSVSYFADPSVGAVSGREEFINLEQNIYTLAEGIYRKYFYTIRLGESKTYSTFLFQGELSLYRRSILDKFEDRRGSSDDTGTVVNILSRGYRCIFIPDAVFYDAAPYTLYDRISLKSRRGQHVISGISEAMKLKLKKNIELPFSIIFFNFYIHIISPLLFILIVPFALLTLYLYHPWYLVLLVISFSLSKKLRILAISYLTSNIALIVALFNHLLGRDGTAWRKIDRMRTTYNNYGVQEISANYIQ
jgi:cellulose synthase/poly-beta-1,6-N-acetylglucosamine synthase-like glycosyltransferase